MILPDAYTRARELTKILPEHELRDAWSPEHGAYAVGRHCEQYIRQEMDFGLGEEIVLQQGDYLIVDPMMYHAATPNTRHDIEGYSRYMLFSTFFDKRTTDHLLPKRGSSAPAIKFPPQMRESSLLPDSLFDWVAPTAEAARAAVHARL